MQNLEHILKNLKNLNQKDNNINTSGISIQIPLEIFITLIDEIQDLKSIISSELKSKSDEKYLNTSEAADLLGCCKQTIHNYRSKGKLIPSKIGRNNLYLRSDIENLLKNDYQNRSVLVNMEGNMYPT